MLNNTFQHIYTLHNASLEILQYLGFIGLLPYFRIKQFILSDSNQNQLLIYGLSILVIVLLTVLIYYIYRNRKSAKVGAEEGKKLFFNNPKAVLSKEKTDEISLKLSKLEADEFYLETNISISNLADKLDTNVKYISTYLNQNLGNNYTTYINQMRMRWLQNKLSTDPEFGAKYTLDTMAKKCGFTSYYALNAACKRLLGKTASEFIKNENCDSRQL